MSGPPRIGIVDMGSNAIRMLVAEAAGNGIAVLENHRLPLRLGREVFESGQVSEAAISNVVDAFRRFRATCDRLGVQQVRAIATAAVREARNRELLLDRVRDASGIEVEVISGTQEAYLLAQAVQTRIDLRRGRSVLVDVGGGSVEVVLVEDGQVVGADSYRLGALRLLSMLPDAAAAGESFVELLLHHLHGLERRMADHFAPGRNDRYVAVGGNIESLADLLRPQGGSNGVETHALAEVRREVQALAGLSNDARIEQKGLKPDRADTIVPAGVVYVRIGEIAGCSHVLVPRVGIKDGLLAEVVAGHRDVFAPEEHVDTVLSACRALGRRFHFESEHAEAVLHLARQLFDQLRPLHGLDRHARVLLEAAALLHDLGVAVNIDGHHKHSQYLIQSSDIVGLDDDERQIVALLARYHRRSPPAREHEEFARLRRRDRTMVERLAAILRLADGLDRQHASLVRSVTARIADNAVELVPTLAAGHQSRLTLERQAVAEKGALFRQLFGKAVLLSPP
jgi:exopolyphosphatase/guanosine-5'-triphosphate,3'-diphosphate pyrophosphatase